MPQAHLVIYSNFVFNDGGQGPFLVYCQIIREPLFYHSTVVRNCEGHTLRDDLYEGHTLCAYEGYRLRNKTVQRIMGK